MQLTLLQSLQTKILFGSLDATLESGIGPDLDAGTESDFDFESGPDFESETGPDFVFESGPDFESESGPEFVFESGPVFEADTEPDFERGPDFDGGTFPLLPAAVSPHEVKLDFCDAEGTTDFFARSLALRFSISL